MGIKHRAPAPPPPTAMASPEPLLSRPIVPAVGQLRAAIRSLDSLHPAPGMSPTSPTSLPAAIAWLTGSRLVPRSSPSSSSLPSLSDDASSATSSSSSSTPPSALASLASLQAADATPIRPNEHLAVFLPKTHWKVRSRLFLTVFQLVLTQSFSPSPTPRLHTAKPFSATRSSPSLSVDTYVPPPPRPFRVRSRTPL